MPQKGFTPLEANGAWRKSKENRPLTGFTILELLVVIAIIGILASMVIATSVRGAAQARDTRRVQELYQIVHALEIYYSVHQSYPQSNDTDDPGCTIHGIAWDAGNLAIAPDDFIKPLMDEEFLGVMPKEWTNIKDAWGSGCIYRYARVENPCDGKCQGTYGILYGVCESPYCPTAERPSCCDGSSWGEGGGNNDKSDIAIFLKSR